MSYPYEGIIMSASADGDAETTECLREEILSLRCELEDYQAQLTKRETQCAVQATEIQNLEELLCKKDGLGQTVVELKHSNTELETQVEEMETKMEELEDEVQTIEDAKLRLDINFEAAKNNFERELKQKEEDMAVLVKQLQEMELELEDEIKQRNASGATKSSENQGACNISNVPSSGVLIIQQCLSARLQVTPQTDDTSGEFVEIGRGIVVYVCFLKGATQATVDKMVKTALTIRLSSSKPGDGKTVSVTELPGDVLIVPQATIGGKAKGRVMQYHANIAKDEGQKLYTAFCDGCQRDLQCASSSEGSSRLKHGTYGNLQVLSMSTPGPHTHTFDF